MVIFVGQGNLFDAEYRKRDKLKFFRRLQKILQKLNKRLDGKRVVA
jgi:hypothetical protein